MKNLILSVSVIIVIALSAWVSKSAVQKGSNVTTVKIGTQTWMTVNLNVDKFRNGDPILHAATDSEWGERRK